MTLGLENAVSRYLAELADGAIHRADQRLLTVRERTNAGLQGAGKERIEGGVGFRIRFGGFAHVYAVAADKPLDDPVLERRGAVIVGQTAGEVGNPQLRRDVLAQNKKLVEH